MLAAHPRDLVVQSVRDALDAARSTVKAGGETPPVEAILAAAQANLERSISPSLRPVLNATGVIIHTNLGRAPLSQEALRAVLQVASGYSNLEFNLQEGDRGSRHDHVAALLRRITGAEDAIAVNNNASAVLLVLSALARDREVVVSRGQAVEIGGGFRIPDVLRQSGARLVEVGTTNRTYLADYEQAITPETGLLLHVHPSNFRVEGFVHEASVDELVELGRRSGLPVVDDLGSGTLLDTAAFGLEHEPMVQERISAGVDAVCFSGDKLLGGPQAGIIAGKAGVIATVRRHPLARAVRVDKMTIAALVATLTHYLNGDATSRVPVWKMISAQPDEIGARASRLARRLRASGVRAEVRDGQSTIGGGSLPGETLKTRVVALPAPGGAASRLAACLRELDPPLVARIERDSLVVDLRTIDPEADSLVSAHLTHAARASALLVAGH